MKNLKTIPGITEEMLLERCNGDIEEATRLSAALVEVMKERYQESKELTDLEGPYMKALLKKIDEDLEWDLNTPWWKKVLVRFGVFRRN